MQVESITSNGSAERNSFNACRSEINGCKIEGVVTYKRRKYSRPCLERNLQEDYGFSVAADRLIGQTIENSANEEDDYTRNRLEHSIHMNSANDFPFGHWKSVMKHILESPNANESSIRRCIRDAFASVRGKDPAHGYDNGCKDHSLLEKDYKTSEHEGIISDGSKKVQDCETNGHTFTKCCQSVFRDVMMSEKFVSLCNLLCEHFKGIKADSVFNFSLFNSRMISGQYAESPELFASDVHQVIWYYIMHKIVSQEWTKFEKIGEEMIHLAKSISDIAQNSFCKQVVDSTHGDSREWRHLEIIQVGAKQNETGDLYTSNQLPFYHSDLCGKPEQTEACGLYKVCTCRECGAEAEDRRSLICDRCEALYHVSCIEPAIEEVPISWYCASCSTDGKELPETESTQIRGEILHTKRVSCQRCKDLSIHICENNKEMIRLSNDSEGTLDCSVKLDKLQVSRESTSSRLCKVCKTGEEDGKKMLVCGNTHCPNKYYHKRCLRLKQLSCPFSCWYCPSCLCRACLYDKDDDMIVLCDGCDEAYHIYCMVPPWTSIPKGNWYCMFCTIVIRARRKMRMRDESVVKKQKIHDERRGNGASGSVDMLLSAAEKLKSMEKLGATRNRYN